MDGHVATAVFKLGILPGAQDRQARSWLAGYTFLVLVMLLLLINLGLVFPDRSSG